MYAMFEQSPRGGGVHDLRMDGGLPPGFHKGTLFSLPKLAVIPTFMTNLAEKHPFLIILHQFLEITTHVEGISEKWDLCFENFGCNNLPIWGAHTSTLNMLCTPPWEQSYRKSNTASSLLDSSFCCCFDLIIKIFLVILGKLFPSDIRYCPKIYFFICSKMAKKCLFIFV